jgi:hypothetical protein
MTVYELKYKISDEYPFYFSKETMKFFGDTFRNYGVRRVKLCGHDCYELYRKKPVLNGLQTSAFFDLNTFKRVRPGIEKKKNK